MGLRNESSNSSSNTRQIDREKVCPFLLRVFWSKGSHLRYEAFDQMPDSPPKNELQIYTWPDATLREIVELIQDVNSESRQRQAKLSFTLIYPDRNGRSTGRKLGILPAFSRRSSEEEEKTLASVGLAAGDYLSLAIL